MRQLRASTMEETRTGRLATAWFGFDGEGLDFRSWHEATLAASAESSAIWMRRQFAATAVALCGRRRPQPSGMRRGGG